MLRSIRNSRKTRAAAEVQMAPLIDMVFILLIFFMVTTVFVKETGVKVTRPQANSAESLDRKSLMIGIDPSGHIFVEERRVDLLSLRSIIQRQLQGQPDRGIVLIADESSQTGVVVQVMDECRFAGAKSIAIAASKVSG